MVIFGIEVDLFKVVVTMTMIIGGIFDIVTWWVAFTNGPLIFMVILINRIIMGHLVNQLGYVDAIIEFYK